MGWGNRRWTEDEDELIRQAARANWEIGIKLKVLGLPFPTREAQFANRLKAVADRLPHRTYAAIRKRAERIGAISYRPRRAA